MISEKDGKLHFHAPIGTLVKKGCSKSILSQLWTIPVSLRLHFRGFPCLRKYAAAGGAAAAGGTDLDQHTRTTRHTDTNTSHTANESDRERKKEKEIRETQMHVYYYILEIYI